MRGNNRLACALDALEPRNGIRSIESSAITGDVLVIYYTGLELPDVISHLENVIRRPP